MARDFNTNGYLITRYDDAMTGAAKYKKKKTKKKTADENPAGQKSQQNMNVYILFRHQSAGASQPPSIVVFKIRRLSPEGL